MKSKRIISQQYAANEPLPDQFALAAEFNTSRMTIQQAMRQLIVEGLVYTRQGQGTFIRKTSFSCRSGISPAATTLARPKPGASGHGNEPVVHFELRFPNEKSRPR